MTAPASPSSGAGDGPDTGMDRAPDDGRSPEGSVPFSCPGCGDGQDRRCLTPVRPAGEAVPDVWHVPGGWEDFAGAARFRFWRRGAASPVGVLHPEGRPEEGLLLAEAHALGCAVPLRLTAAEHALLGHAPARGLAFFLCLGILPERPGETVLAVRAALAVALGDGTALRLSLPQPGLPDEVPMWRLAAGSLD